MNIISGTCTITVGQGEGERAERYVGIHTALVAGLAEPLQKGLYSLCLAVAPVPPCAMREYAQRVCYTGREHGGH
jgi:hypothetical protein